MTSFLRLNGIDVPVQDGSASLSQEDIGAEHRAVDGTPVWNRRTTKRKWSFRTSIQDAAHALAFRDLITGKGHVLNGVGVVSGTDQLGLYTSKGLAPTTLGAQFYSIDSSGKFTIPCPSKGAGLWPVALNWAATFTATYTMFTSSSPWSIAWWENYNASSYHHHVLRSDGSKWLDGVVDVSAVHISGSAGVLTFGGAALAGSVLCDIIAMPFLCPTDWPAQWYAYGNTGATYAQGPLPRLNADGLFIEQNSLISVKGKVNDLKAFQAMQSGVVTPHMHDFGFELWEA